MGESVATLNPYILYSVLGFNALLMAVLLGAVLRLMFLMGRMDGRLSGLETAVADLRQDNANLRQDNANLRQEMTNLRQEMANLRQETRQEISGVWQEMTNLRQEMADLRQEMVAHITRLDGRIDRLEASLADLREQVAENRGLLLALHQKVDLLMIHRHDETSGAVLLTPTAVPDPAAD